MLQPAPTRLATFLTASALALLSSVLGGCAANPWSKAYEGFGGAGAASMTAEPRAANPVLELVEFEDATRGRGRDGLEQIGFANFTGVYYRGIEDDLRRQGREVGADLVAWGLRYLHTERETTLRPVQDVWTSKRRGRYDPRTGRYDDETIEWTETRYVPEVYDNAYYAFRAVFYRDAR
ncbi:MAG: hypothetical protein ACF8SC_07100 [Phycisphaerales bacterium JB037]